MRITDKQRLDWLDLQPRDFRGFDGLKSGVWYRAGDYYDLSCLDKNIRQIIDAAIRAERMRK